MNEDEINAAGEQAFYDLLEKAGVHQDSENGNAGISIHGTDREVTCVMAMLTQIQVNLFKVVMILK